MCNSLLQLFLQEGRWNCDRCGFLCRERFVTTCRAFPVAKRTATTPSATIPLIGIDWEKSLTTHSRHIM